MQRTVRVRLATFNIKHGAPAQAYRGDPAAVAEACADLEADVLALQEVDIGIPRSGRADLAAAAAHASGMNAVFAHTMRTRGGRYGNALLVRGEFEDNTVLKLKSGTRWVQSWPSRGRLLPAWREPRNAIVATVRIGGHRLSVAATHLSARPKVSSKQLRQAVARLRSMPEPWVLLGDLNLSTDDARSEPLLEPMELVGGTATFPAWNPTKRLDHIAFRGLAALDADGVKAVRFPQVSDHLALVVDVDVLP